MHRILALTSIWPLLAGLTLRLDAQRVPEITLRRGLVITRSVRIKPGTYYLPAPASVDSALVTIRGNNVVVDFNGATLLSSKRNAVPDERAGVAVRIVGGRNVTVRRARIHGYRIAIRATGTRGLRLLDNDLSRSWAPRLFSLVEHESLVDWLSFHHNDKAEWLRFGAAMYLDRVRGGEIRGNTAEHGMNGLLLTRSDSLLIWNNVLSFNSGLGIGLYRSSANRIMHNHLDYNVRGYSHGFYRRGQDSAGLLVYEQSCRNVIAFNSVTHSGDGLFLWAGQSTMDSGEGGANDNVVFANDFSYAPTNGMETTFSRNVIVQNHVAGSDYGLWGGYSFESVIAGNTFERNRVGIAIEHGQKNRIAQNVFRGDSTAVRLWGDSLEPSDWGYPKHRDTRSATYEIVRNLFEDNRVGTRLSRTTSVELDSNRFVNVDTVIVADGVPRVERANSVARIVDAVRPTLVPALPRDMRAKLPKPLAKGLRRAHPMAALPRSAIIVDEWGPYDWRRPKLWPMDSVRAVPLRLLVLGPPGSWRLVTMRGLSALSKREGRISRLGVPDTVAITPVADSSGDWSVTLELRRPSGSATRFSYGHFEPQLDWSVRLFQWSDSTDPRTHADAFADLLKGVPLTERRWPRLDLLWFRPPMASIPAARWALEASTTVSLDGGSYYLQTISDDAIRVWVDDSLAIDNWQPHDSQVDVAPLSAGRHELRVRYVQVDGWTELRVDIGRGAPPKSRGSPGPH